MLKLWNIRDRRCVHKFYSGEVWEHNALNPRNGEDHVYTVFRYRPWVCIVAITENDELILVKQFRHGVEGITTEIPAGNMDEGESDPRGVAIRELREETGYVGKKVTSLGWIHPNPACQGNQCHLFLITGCQKSEDQDLDPGEDIEVVLKPLSQVKDLLLSHELSHSMHVAAVCKYLFMKDEYEK